MALSLTDLLGFFGGGDGNQGWGGNAGQGDVYTPDGGMPTFSSTVWGQGAGPSYTWNPWSSSGPGYSTPVSNGGGGQNAGFIPASGASGGIGGQTGLRPFGQQSGAFGGLGPPKVGIPGMPNALPGMLSIQSLMRLLQMGGF